jgi:nicotinamidase-related amidase
MQHLPVPSFFTEDSVKEMYWTPYQQREAEAIAWRKSHNIPSSATDQVKVCLMIIDAQNTFCVPPKAELFVGGRSGTGAIDDNVRLSKFIYENLPYLTSLQLTMDTHRTYQIFHSSFWINDAGENPPPGITMIMLEDVLTGVWKVNPLAAAALEISYTKLQAHAVDYVRALTDGGKYPLLIWPYHAMLGGPGHNIVGGVEEAAFFHSIAKARQTGLEIKGGNPLTENYSVLAPEVLSTDGWGKPFAQKNARFLEVLLNYDMIIIAGQAKSHCVAWTIADLLGDIKRKDENLAKKVFLMEDMTSSVVIPGAGPELDFTDAGNDSFARFSREGMNVVSSSQPMWEWVNSPFGNAA